MLTKGTNVTWIENGIPGRGQVISAEQNRHVLVAVDAEPGYRHPVIYYAATWLEAIES